jgi:hypothetical protein
VFVILDGPLSVSATGDHRDRSLLAQGGTDAARVIAAVSDHPLHADGFADQQVRALHIRCVSGRQDEAEWSPEDSKRCFQPTAVQGMSSPTAFAG